MEEKNLSKYLKRIGLPKGSADFLAGKYGDKILQIIAEKPMTLSPYLSSKEIFRARALDAKYRYAQPIFRMLEEESTFSPVSIFNIWDKCGKEDAVKKIKENPYIIQGYEDFKKLDDFALSRGENPRSKRRIEAAIKEVLDTCDSNRNPNLERVHGSTCVPKKDLYQYTTDFLGDEELPESTFSEVLRSMHVARKLHIAYSLPETPVYPLHLAEIEYDTARIIKRKLKKSTQFDNLSTLIDRAQAELGILLSDEQSNAVRMALNSSVSVITGGPGTGKTSVQKVLIEAFEWATKCKSVRLMAPTGQAAKRMTESTGYPATTIHKALGLLAGEKIIVKDDVFIDDGLIIADEASMVDEELFHALISHISDDSKLVIVGDIEQLPSIGIGSVLRELILAEAVPTTRLTKVFRQASDSPIAYNAARVKTGEQEYIENELFRFIETGSGSTPEETSLKIAEAASAEYAQAVAAEGIENVICLTAFRRYTATGVNQLNERLRKAVRKDIDEKTPFVVVEGKVFYEGDRIVYGKNKGQLVNGDLGVIKQVINPRSAICSFGEGRDISLIGAELEAIDLAYAQTVHSVTCSCLKRAGVA